MRKYWAVFKINWQVSAEYRVDFISRFFRDFITLAVIIFIFKAIFASRETFSGYTFSSMLTYFVMTRVMHFTNRGNTARWIANEIKEGILSVDLLKPISCLKRWFSLFLADRFFEMLIRFSLTFIFLFLFPAYFTFPSVGKFSLFLSFLVISLLFNFLINLILAVTAFWVTDIRLFDNFVGLTISFLAGSVVPLDILPTTIQKISLYLPFQYCMYFPIKIYQGSLNYQQILMGISISVIWLGVFWGLVNYFWQKGLKHYEAVGQ